MKNIFAFNNKKILMFELINLIKSVNICKHLTENSKVYKKNAVIYRVRFIGIEKELLHMDEEKDVYISRDQVRFEMVPETDEYFSREKEVYEEWIKRIAWALNAGFNVWADAAHLNKKSRAKTFHALTKKGIDFASIEVTALVMDTPFLVCMERNSKRK